MGRREALSIADQTLPGNPITLHKDQLPLALETVRLFADGPLILLAKLCLPLADAELEALAVLCPERRTKALRYKNKDDAARCLLAGWLLRHGASAFLGREEDEVTTAHDARGKPFFPQIPELHATIAHQGPWVGCGLHARPLGMDVEQVAPLKNAVATGGLAEVLLCAEEHAYYRTLAAPDKAAYLIETWTLKESVLKMLGVGFNLAPDALCLQHALESAPPCAVVAATDIDSGRYRLAICYAPPNFIEQDPLTAPRPSVVLQHDAAASELLRAAFAGSSVRK